MAVPGKRWCSKCVGYQDIGNFKRNNRGKLRKLCKKHPGKRDFDEICDDAWDTFVDQLRSWNIVVRKNFICICDGF